MVLVAYPTPRTGLEPIWEHVRALAEEREAAQREIAALRRALDEREAQLGALQVSVADLSDRERELRTMILDTGDELLRRGEDLEALMRRVGAALDNLPYARHAHRAGGMGYRLPAYVSYQAVVHRIRGVIRAALPSEATVIVVSKGDEDLLSLDGRRGWHFPQTEAGVYAGHYPADSDEAIGHLEALRARGGEFLVFPSTALWWLDHYAGFGRHLETHYRVALRREDTCLIFALHDEGR
jgi:hypothetical protein